jgi:hypothetical protein
MEIVILGKNQCPTYSKLEARSGPKSYYRGVAVDEGFGMVF